MRTTSTQPGPNEPEPFEPVQPNPIEPAVPDGTPEEFPFVEPKYFPMHPDIPTQPIHEPTPGRPIA
ncbi:MAG TPA: hypothetical protein VLT33_24405 [Labilithrix sp.]|nr:hypothetical protein [Labilithrix sp.]